MKRLVYLFVMLGVIAMYSCGGSSSEKAKEAKDKNTEIKSGAIKDCDDFLTHYEEWVDDYIKVLDDYFKNPADQTIATRYMELMQEAMEWNTKWIALVDCADDEEYEKKFEEISKDIEKKLEEIGL